LVAGTWGYLGAATGLVFVGSRLALLGKGIERLETWFYKSFKDQSRVGAV
jgi:hypothetical protein